MKKPEPKPQFVHIAMVGTSLLTNNNWNKGQPLPARRDLLEKLRRGNPRDQSAELSGLVSFIDRSQCTRVHLLETDTPESRLCCGVLTDWLRRPGINITKATAKDLLPSLPAGGIDQQAFNRGIRGFRELVFRVVRQAQRRGERVFLNATGGLKAEVAVAVLVAAELGIEAYYTHKSADAPVFLPTGPLNPGLRKWLQDHMDDTIPRGGDATEDICLQLENEGLAKIARRDDGTIAQIRLTSYGKYWAKQRFDG